MAVPGPFPAGAPDRVLTTLDDDDARPAGRDAAIAGLASGLRPWRPFRAPRPWMGGVDPGSGGVAVCRRILATPPHGRSEPDVDVGKFRAILVLPRGDQAGGA